MSVSQGFIESGCICLQLFTEIQTLQDLWQAVRHTWVAGFKENFISTHTYIVYSGWSVVWLAGLNHSTARQRNGFTRNMFVTMRVVISATTMLNFIGRLAASVLQHHRTRLHWIMKVWYRNLGTVMSLGYQRLLCGVSWKAHLDVAEGEGCHAYMFSRLSCSSGLRIRWATISFFISLEQNSSTCATLDRLWSILVNIG